MKWLASIRWEVRAQAYSIYEGREEQDFWATAFAPTKKAAELEALEDLRIQVEEKLRRYKRHLVAIHKKAFA